MHTQQTFNRRQFIRIAGFGAASVALFAGCAAPAAAPAAPAGGAVASGNTAAKEGGQLEMFSWWTTGGENAGLEAMYKIYKDRHPGVEIINQAVAGGSGAGGNAKAVLKRRFLSIIFLPAPSTSPL
ncbi:MAG: hypothetical protein U0350_11805 [Caldilineaceae bacterium]